MIGILSQKLLTGPDDTLHVVVEHLQNEGATREWVRRTKLPEIADFLRRGESPANRSFLTSLVEATESGLLTAETAAEASLTPNDFYRALRGIR